MPELPEVETVVRDLKKMIVGQTITDVAIIDRRVIKDRTNRQFKQSLKSKTIKSIARRAKGIIIQFTGGDYLFVHLKMTGQLIYGERQNLKETKVVFTLSDGNYLNYNDQRLFGWLIYTKNLKTIGYIQTAGPEPLGRAFNADFIREAIKRRTVPVKTLLLNQFFVAGIGNIYASEILHRARINPTKPSFKLTDTECERLYEQTVNVLKESIRYRGTSMRNYRDSKGRQGQFMSRIRVYNREGQDCLHCGTKVMRIVQSGRSTFFCSACQK